MKGTEKQVAWAEKIRNKKEFKIAIAFESARKMCTELTKENQSAALKAVDAAESYYNEHKEDARFWIDIRDMLDPHSDNLKYDTIEFKMIGRRPVMSFIDDMAQKGLASKS